MVAKLAGFLLLLLTCGAVQANADSIYEITGTLTASANGSNPGVSETINFSFMLDYKSPYSLPTFVGTPTITSFGPLGTFSLFSSRFNSYGISVDFIGFYSPSAEIDLNGLIEAWGTGINYHPAPVIGGSSMFWSCYTQAACTLFYPDAGGGEAIGSQLNSAYGLWGPGTASASVYLVSTPEPGTLCLSVLGALALCLMKKTLTH